VAIVTIDMREQFHILLITKFFLICYSGFTCTFGRDMGAAQLGFALASLFLVLLSSCSSTIFLRRLVVARATALSMKGFVCL
jgi:hypothetical protein